MRRAANIHRYPFGHIMNKYICPALGRYRHYKGNFYHVLGMTQHSEDKDADGEPARLVLYRRELDGSMWSRPLAMWSEPVPADKLVANGSAPKADGTETLRFEKCD